MNNKYNDFGERLKRFFTQFDFIGPQFSFQNSDSCRFQSLQGTIWSFIAFSIMAIVGYFLSKEVYERKTPITSSNRENTAYSDIYFKEFPLLFTLITPKGKILDATNFKQYVTPFITRIVYDNNGNLLIDDKINDFESCEIDKFTLYSNLVKEEIIKKNDGRYLCLKFHEDDYFSNTIFAANSTNYNIGLKLCKENCADDLNEVIHGALLDITYINSFVNMNDYVNPISKYFEHLTTQLDLFFRRSYMRFVYNTLSTDYGWFEENIKIEDFPYLESLVPDDLNWAKEGQFKDTLFIVSVESPKSKMVFNRKYLKLQQAMASLGGISHALILIVRLVSDTHLKFLMYFFIRTAAVDSLIKNDLENSISMNMKEKGQSNKNLEKVNFDKLKEKYTKDNNNNLEESSCSDMRLEKPKLPKEDKDNMQSPVVQTVIRFNNENIEKMKTTAKEAKNEQIKIKSAVLNNNKEN